MPAVRHLLWLSLLLLPAHVAAQTVDFSREVRPILSDACYKCHGPDATQRKAKLRLDTEEGAKAVLVAGKPEKSELYRRITADEAREHMPPASSGRKLTKPQIDTLRRWIEQGAKWSQHWAFVTPKRPELPAVKSKGWIRNPIDAFILARLEAEGLSPSPEADKTTLIRRVTLDLTGLPPTPAEVDAFLKDDSPEAYERVVDRLLKSPRYGERMAIRWLDAARYADTNGYQSDGERFMWRWRDWVIDAFNSSMPFDRFTVEQVAGDMLPNATLDQKIATGFNRNHRGNAEGGVIPEEFAVEYVVDRVDTTATVWLGLTMGCARCHDHKFDPIATREYYQTFAYFNNVPEQGRAIKYGNSPPYIKAPTREQRARQQELEAKLRLAEEKYRLLQPERQKAQAAWEKTLAGMPALDWSPAQHLVVHKPLDDAKTDVPGRVGKAAGFDGKFVIEAGDVADFGFYDKFTVAAWVKPAGNGTIVSRMTDVEHGDGWSVRIEKGKLQVLLTKRWLDDALRVETEAALSSDQWQHVAVVYDGSRLAAGVTVYLDGRLVKTKVLLDELNQTFNVKEPLRIGAGGGPESRFRGAIDDVRIYDDTLTAEEAAILATSETITDIAALSPDKRTDGQRLKIERCFLEKHAPEDVRKSWHELTSLRRELERFNEGIPTTMVMVEMPKPRDTFVLLRGVYDRRGEKVSPAVPTALGAVPEKEPNNRLGFARWLVHPANPLTARVAVNRFWQAYFGTGIVKTVDDFGSQGEPPSHPELLDWLATEFLRTGWDVKAMQKLIVTSAAYRQSSRLTKDLLQKDPDNRLLARGPRFRLSAEMIRDQALFVSGLLVEKLGGPSVRPYQPAGLAKDLGADPYVQGKGEDLYRRSLYTFWKRTVAPPTMMTFDAANRETCVVRETRTNTPLQALSLMNDVTFVEASRVFAERIMTEAKQPEDRLTLAFRLATARLPKPAEMKVLVEAYQYHLARYRADVKAANKLVAVGEKPRNEKFDPSELAAYTAVASMILNLDEVITKE